MLKFIIIDTFIQFRAIETFFLKIVEKKFQIFSFGGPYEFDFLPLVPQRKKKILIFFFFFKNYLIISNMLKFIILDTFFQFRAIETFFLKIINSSQICSNSSFFQF